MQNGKGDKNRITNLLKFRMHYDEINWGKGHKKCNYLDETDGCPKCGADRPEDCGEINENINIVSGVNTKS
jgi:hypothetical protein